MNASAMVMPKKYFFDRDGNPLAYGKVYTYETLTSNTNKVSYTTEEADVENTNPVILNGEGYAPIYLKGTYNIVVDDADDNNIWTADPVSSNLAEEWIHCQTPTYISTTSFKVPGDLTTEYEENRAVFIDNNGPIVYSTIVSASFASGETTIVVLDAVVDAAVTQVCVSFVGPDSMPLLSAINVTYDQGASGSVETTVAAKLGEGISVLDFGADPTGVLDSTTAFINAEATAGRIRIPGGTYNVSPTAHTLATNNGMAWIGDSKLKSIIRATSVGTMMEIAENAFYWSIRHVRFDCNNIASLGISSAPLAVGSNNGICDITQVEVRNSTGDATDFNGLINCDINLYTQDNVGTGLQLSNKSNVNRIKVWSIRDGEGCTVDNSVGNEGFLTLENCGVGFLHVRDGSDDNTFRTHLEGDNPPSTYGVKIDGANTNSNTLEYGNYRALDAGGIMDIITIGDLTNQVRHNKILFGDFGTVNIAGGFAHVNVLNGSDTIIGWNFDNANDQEITVTLGAGTVDTKFERSSNRQNYVTPSTDLTSANALTAISAYLTDITTGATDKTVELPDPATCKGTPFKVRKRDTGAGLVLITATGGALFHGSGIANGAPLFSKNDWVEYTSDGTVWRMTGERRTLQLSLTPVSVAANSMIEQDFTVTGLSGLDLVAYADGPTQVSNLSLVTSRSKTTNTLSLTFFNNTAGALVPAASTYKFLLANP